MFETNFSFHECKIAHYGKSLIFVFQGIFTSTEKIFITEGGLSTRQ